MIISIVVPVLNEEKTLPALLGSISQLSLDEGDRCELVIVDNGSTDGTVEVCTLTADKLLKCEGSVSDARFAGVAASSGELVILVDADHIVDQRCVALCVAELAKQQHLNAIITAERAYNPSLLVEKALSLERELIERSGRGIPRVFRRERILSVMQSLKSESFGEDYSILFALSESEIRYVPSAILYHREVRSLAVLARKYFSYALRGKVSTIVAATSFRSANLLGVALSIALREPVLFGLVIGIRAIKTASVALGVTTAALLSFTMRARRH